MHRRWSHTADLPIRHASRLTCQTRGMRPVGSVLGFLAWRVGVARTGFGVRLRRMVSTLVVVSGIGAAIGYAVVGRFLAAPEEEDEVDTRPDAE